MRSQQVMLQDRAPELSMSSKQQPGSLPRIRPVTVEAGIAAVVLTALGFGFVLVYGIASATVARNGYSEMQARQQIEDLRARTALLRYQNRRAESSASADETAKRLKMVMSDAAGAVDFVALPSSSPAQVTRLALRPAGERATITSVVSRLAEEVGAGGRAEASTDSGHRP
ncbi:MAG: hypothetical protein ACE149_05675 [Armatimonadota bacterium]